MLSVRNMIAILVTIAILMGVFFVATLYYPTNKRAKRIARSRAILEAQIEGPTPPGAKEGAGEDIVDLMGMDVNFFKNRNLSPMKGIPDLLEEINRMGDQMNIRFVAVKPLEDEDAPGYRKYPFLIETRASYAELVNFVHRIENGLRLSLNDLRMESDEKDPTIHRLQFTLNILELKDELPAGQGGLAGNENIRPEKIPLVAIHRDPFGAKKPVTVSPPPEKPRVAEVIPPEPRRPSLVLMGIMDIAGSKIAIIDNEILRPGEMVGQQRIDHIADDHVILLDGDETDFLYLKGSTPPQKREGKK